jgi:CheY-like chemotaxis protein
MLVTVANNGQEALDMIQTGGNFDLVLMDIQMPVMDGLTAARGIRAAGLADLPIVALTAHSLPEDREKSLRAGMNEHLTKPLNIKELLHCLSLYLKPGQNCRL